MSSASERYRILQNIIAQKGLDADLFMELARAESMVNAIEQGKMMPPPLPQDISQDITPMSTDNGQPPQESLPTNNIPSV